MFVRERWGWKTVIRVYAIRHGTERKLLWEGHNAIMDGARRQVRLALQLGGVDLGIRYAAVGSSAAPINTAATRLGSEWARRQVLQQQLQAPAAILTVAYFDQFLAGQIEELGWFGGPEATEAADTGVLVGRVLWSHAKTNQEALEIHRIDMF